MRRFLRKDEVKSSAYDAVQTEVFSILIIFRDLSGVFRPLPHNNVIRQIKSPPRSVSRVDVVQRSTDKAWGNVTLPLIPAKPETHRGLLQGTTSLSQLRDLTSQPQWSHSPGPDLGICNDLWSTVIITCNVKYLSVSYHQIAAPV